MHRRCLRRLSTGPAARPDPFAVLGPHLASIRASLLSMLGSGHPAVSEITQYYFRHPSKQIRPVIVLLMSQATNGLGKSWHKKLWEAESQGPAHLDRPYTHPSLLTDWNPSMPDHTAKFETNIKQTPYHRPESSYPCSSSSASSSSTPTLSPTLLPTQLRLAQIVEMLHTASLLHDDVIDESALRRGSPSAPSAFGNKLSVLGGNFVLGRASAALARLGDPEVTELIASVLSNLVEGEILQMKKVRLGKEKEKQAEQLEGKEEGKEEGAAVQTAGESSNPELKPTDKSSERKDAWNIYLQKTYLKTASLMAKGARSAVVLGGCDEGEVWKEVAYAYGRNLGIAFQLVDDVLDYEYASSTLGKPGGADLQLGLATAPALYAWEEHDEMGELIQRKFANKGDVDLARTLVHRSSGVQRTRELAQAYADKAKEVLGELPDSEAKRGLEGLTERVIGRKS